ncbi:MAG TPA: alanine racemase, partial [Patescibacteria group bacterium]|nr:alanine racemase [Patescibacteria group bacterium]
MKLLHWLRTIKKHFVHYDPSVKILISKTNLLHNLKEYQKKYPTLLCAPVLKSNAYGHGLIPIAQILDKQQLPFFVLDSLYEAMLLRDAGIHSKILIIGYTSADNIRHSTLAHIAFVITSLEQLQEVANAITTTTTIHLKIDTGMHRQGILPHQIPDALHIIQANTFLSLDGVCSHFADADNPDATFTKSQIVCWEKAVAICKQQCRSIQYFHISATSGALYS